MNKNAGVSADAFDIILTMWAHLKEYRSSLFFVLEVKIFDQNFYSTPTA
jgi:hypothetical protein